MNQRKKDLHLMSRPSQFEDKRGSELKNSEPLFKFPLNFHLTRLGLYKPTRLGYFWTLICPIGHLL